MKREKLCRVSVLAGAVAVGLSGCAGGIKTQNGIAITSKPSGAMVYASGTEVGRTPLRINPSDYFSAGFVHDEQGLVYRYKGTLSLKRHGCETYTQPVDDAVLAKDIHVQLACSPGAGAPPAEQPAPARPAHPAASTAPAPSTPAATPRAPGGGELEQRLRRAKRLYEQGLITEQEYRQVRERILKEL